MEGHPNLAVLEAKHESLENLVHDLAAVVKSLVAESHTLLETAKLHQLRIENIEKVCDKSCMPKLNELWEERSKFKGGYIVLSMLGGIIIGAAAVGTLIIQILK